MPTATWKSTTIANASDEDIVVVEGNVYFPRTAVHEMHLTPSDTTTVCPWKGTAHYCHVTVGGETNRDAAWYYPEPKAAAEEIRDRFAFWKGISIAR